MDGDKLSALFMFTRMQVGQLFGGMRNPQLSAFSRLSKLIPQLIRHTAEEYRVACGRGGNNDIAFKILPLAPELQDAVTQLVGAYGLQWPSLCK